MEWEITTEDVNNVLVAHKIVKANKDLYDIHAALDHDVIIDRLMYYTKMEDQTASMLSDIEDVLMRNNVIKTTEKKFHNP